MAALADTLNSVASALSPLLDELAGKSDPQSQARFDSLSDARSDLLMAAMQANAQDVESKVASDAAAVARLNAFTAQANDKATQLAVSEANVTRFANLATHITSAIAAGGSGNIAGCVSALSSACGDLGIAVP